MLPLKAQEEKFHALNQWFQTNQGLHVAHAFTEELSSLSSILSGDILLQLGEAGNNPWLAPLHYSHKWLITPYFSPNCAAITSLYTLSLDRNSVDCILAPLSLEGGRRRENPLDEMDRILKPMGYLIFFGINPYSLWGISLRLGWHSDLKAFTSRPLSLSSLKRTLFHRGYMLCYTSKFYFLPPLFDNKWIKRLECLNKVSKIMKIFPAGFYCLIVQKFEERYTNFILETSKEEALTKEIPLQTFYR